MANDLYFKKDIERTLASIYDSMMSTAQESDPGPAFRRGFEAALNAVASGFGAHSPVEIPQIAEFHYYPDLRQLTVGAVRECE